MSQRDWIIDALGQPATTECVLVPWQPSQAHPNVWLGADGVPSVGAAALILSGSPRPVGMEVCHDPATCNNGRCVNLAHLRWDTHQSNNADKVHAGTDDRGEKSSNAKLTKAQVGEIRALRGMRTQRDISNEYGISQSNVSMIQAGQRWRHG